MDEELQSLMALLESHQEPGQRLFNACEGTLYPCDGLAMAVLDRSMSLLKGFHLLLSNGGFVPGAGLLRMQLDNVLRFHGVVVSGDPHGLANQMANGVNLNVLKNGIGTRLTDRNLVKLLAPANPGIEEIYTNASGYVHLSGSHIGHFLTRSKIDSQGNRLFAIGDDDEYMDPNQKRHLISVFATLTRCVLHIVQQWANGRESHGTSEELAARFKHAL